MSLGRFITGVIFEQQGICPPRRARFINARPQTPATLK
jgi:hypothetical protein